MRRSLENGITASVITAVTRGKPLCLVLLLDRAVVVVVLVLVLSVLDVLDARLVAGERGRIMARPAEPDSGAAGRALDFNFLLWRVGLVVRWSPNINVWDDPIKHSFEQTRRQCFKTARGCVRGVPLRRDPPVCEVNITGEPQCRGVPDLKEEPVGTSSATPHAQGNSQVVHNEETA